jgi:hypothetical protein
MDDNNSLTIYGLSRSLPLLLVFIVAFVGLAYTMAMLLFNNPLISIVSGALALTLCGAIYGIMRYYAEQIIMYISANINVIARQKSDDGVNK